MDENHSLVEIRCSSGVKETRRMTPKSGDRAVLDASGIATGKFFSGSARDTPLRMENYGKIARE
jgi:hypothetical protein